MAQYDLGIFYYSGLTFIRNIKKSIYYFKLVSKNGSRRASFCYGFLLHEGRDIKRNILKAIHYYNDASSFNNKHAKNNLGIIYKNGFGDEIISRVGNAIEYFEEAIQQGDDCLSMYNLAHIYIYNKSFEKDFDKSLELLIISSRKFHHSLVLLCFVLIKKFGTDMDAIQNQIEKISNKTDNLSSKVFENIRNMQLYNKKIFEDLLIIDHLYFQIFYSLNQQS